MLVQLVHQCKRRPFSRDSLSPHLYTCIAILVSNLHGMTYNNINTEVYKPLTNAKEFMTKTVAVIKTFNITESMTSHLL